VSKINYSVYIYNFPYILKPDGFPFRFKHHKGNCKYSRSIALHLATIANTFLRIVQRKRKIRFNRKAPCRLLLTRRFYCYKLVPILIRGHRRKASLKPLSRHGTEVSGGFKFRVGATSSQTAVLGLTWKRLVREHLL